MDCSEARELFNLKLDGTLGKGQADALDRHLRTCDGCRREFESLRRIDCSLDSIILEKAPARLTAVVMKDVAKGRVIERVARVAAPLAAAVSIGFYLLRPALEGAARITAEGLDGTMSGLSQTFQQWSGAFATTESELLERAAEVPRDGIPPLVVAGAAAIFLVVYALRLWRALALEWYDDTNGAGA